VRPIGQRGRIPHGAPQSAGECILRPGRGVEQTAVHRHGQRAQGRHPRSDFPGDGERITAVQHRRRVQDRDAQAGFHVEGGHRGHDHRRRRRTVAEHIAGGRLSAQGQGVQHAQAAVAVGHDHVAAHRRHLAGIAGRVVGGVQSGSSKARNIDHPNAGIAIGDVGHGAGDGHSHRIAVRIQAAQHARVSRSGDVQDQQAGRSGGHKGLGITDDHVIGLARQRHAADAVRAGRLGHVHHEQVLVTQRHVGERPDERPDRHLEGAGSLRDAVGDGYRDRSRAGLARHRRQAE